MAMVPNKVRPSLWSVLSFRRTGPPQSCGIPSQRGVPARKSVLHRLLILEVLATAGSISRLNDQYRL